MALRYINWTYRFGRFYGKYEECYPDLARGICETFYADDTELAACFRVPPAMIERWQRSYPDFKKQIHAGRSHFTRRNGSDVYRQRWFRLRFAAVARNICKEFKPTKRQLARCFGIFGIVEKKSWKELDGWMKEYCYETVWTRLEKIQHRVFNKTINNICWVFKPNDEQLARCLDMSVKEAAEILDDWKLKMEEGKRVAEGLWRLLSESPETEADKGVGCGEEREKQQ